VQLLDERCTSSCKLYVDDSKLFMHINSPDCAFIFHKCLDKLIIWPITWYDHFTRSPTYWIWSKWSNLYIKTFTTLSGVKTVFFILLKLDILCASAVKRYCA